ncbi:DUF6882 domain-containing protein [Mesorhizobium sp. WSM4315]|uniref:DUF6882 domain-containing protein n=1 Tax=unclassified Mesorhizobium TaxID=325217 RepID=UPI0032B2AE5A
MQPDWYPAWRDEAFEQLTAKNAILEKEFRLGRWPRYDYDLTTGRLLFSDNGAVKVVAEIQIAGSTAPRPATGFGRGRIPTCPTNFLPTPIAFVPSARRMILPNFSRLL